MYGSDVPDDKCITYYIPKTQQVEDRDTFVLVFFDGINPMLIHSVSKNNFCLNYKKNVGHDKWFEVMCESIVLYNELYNLSTHPKYTNQTVIIKDYIFDNIDAAMKSLKNGISSILELYQDSALSVPDLVLSMHHEDATRITDLCRNNIQGAVRDILNNEY
jgi:hypothetical protein